MSARPPLIRIPNRSASKRPLPPINLPNHRGPSLVRARATRSARACPANARLRCSSRFGQPVISDRLLARAVKNRNLRMVRRFRVHERHAKSFFQGSNGWAVRQALRRSPRTAIAFGTPSSKLRGSRISSMGSLCCARNRLRQSVRLAPAREHDRWSAPCPSPTGLAAPAS